jgi:hypothetical protein
VEVLRQEKLIDASSFNVDFRSISYFGDDPFVDKCYVPRHGQRRKAVLTFFARDVEGQVFCYSNADLRRGEEADEVLRFVEFWRQKYGQAPRHLVFVSKLTTYEKLSRLNGSPGTIAGRWGCCSIRCRPPSGSSLGWMRGSRNSRALWSPSWRSWMRSREWTGGWPRR